MRCRNCQTEIDTSILSHCPTCGTPVDARGDAGGTGRRLPSGRLVGVLIAVVLVGGGAIHALADRPTRDSQGALTEQGELFTAGLRVGDCLDVPGDPTAAFSTVTALPCDLPHQLEKYLDIDHPAEPGAEWPGDEQMSDWAVRQCYSGFESYVGRAYEEAMELDFYFFFPARQAWQANERTIQCFVMRADEGRVTGSLRSSSET